MITYVTYIHVITMNNKIKDYDYLLNLWYQFILCLQSYMIIYATFIYNIITVNNKIKDAFILK